MDEAETILDRARRSAERFELMAEAGRLHLGFEAAQRDLVFWVDQLAEAKAGCEIARAVRARRRANEVYEAMESMERELAALNAQIRALP